MADDTFLDNNPSVAGLRPNNAIHASIHEQSPVETATTLWPSWLGIPKTRSNAFLPDAEEARKNQLQECYGDTARMPKNAALLA
ncbi:hypothetical protein [Bordetella avium]|uniref:hypothetical protein n=1 Tax=Bordetella avium TaxID=521 RepID=UPI0039FC1A46